MLSGELWRIVSSNRKISLSLITTMSGRAEESKVSVGIVAGGLSLNHWLGGQQINYPPVQGVFLVHSLVFSEHNRASRYTSPASELLDSLKECGGQLESDCYTEGIRVYP